MTANTEKLIVGTHYKGEGIFLGEWNPVDREGRPLGTIFNLFAATEDLKRTATYTKTIEKISTMPQFHGYTGVESKDDVELYKLIRDGKYNGEWFLPTINISIGKREITPYTISMSSGTLYDNREEGSLKNTFNTEAERFSCAHRYWTCTKDKNFTEYAYNINFTDGSLFWDIKDDYSFSTRLVRAVPKI